MNYGCLRCNVQIQELGAESKISEPPPRGTVFLAPKNWAEAVAPKVVRPVSPLKVEEPPEVETEEEEGRPNSKKRRTVETQPAAASSALTASTAADARMHKLGQRQANMDRQLAQLMLMVQGISAAVVPAAGGAAPYTSLELPRKSSKRRACSSIHSQCLPLMHEGHGGRPLAAPLQSSKQQTSEVDLLHDGNDSTSYMTVLLLWNVVAWNPNALNGRVGELFRHAINLAVIT